MAKVGYIRVSSGSQNPDRQLDGLSLDKTFEEIQSGRDMQGRPVLKECLNWLREGDILYIHSIDRLARSMIDLQKIVSDLLARDITVSFLKEKLEFAPGTVDPVQKLIFNMLGAYAEFERTLIQERQQEGYAAAKRHGKKMGRPKKIAAKKLAAIENDLEDGMLPSDVAFKHGIGKSTVYKIRNGVY